MTDIIDRLKEPEAHYPGNFDTPKRANAMLSCLCQEAVEEIESLRQQLAEKDAEIARLYRDQEQYGPDKVAIEKQAWVEADRQRQINELRKQLAEKDAEIERLKLAANIGKSKDIRALAEILLSDCGCSTEHRALLDKVENRLWTFFDEQLAASQAREQELRGAFQTYIDEHEECTDADDWMAMTCSMEAHHVADEALAQPADTTALQAVIAKAGEVMRERCAVECETHYNFSNALAAAIRAIPGVTLEDIK